MMRGTQPPAVTPEMYKEVFEDHPTGRLVLDDLIRRFTRPAVTDGGIDAVLKTFNHAGQRKPLDHIVTQINRAHGVSDTQGEQEDVQA